ncbi:MAG: hypothetical protein AAFU65_09375 [Pseudomonadota bacterium]
MTDAAALISLSLAFAGFWCWIDRRQPLLGLILTLASLALQMGVQGPVKALFTWLALVGLAGGLAVVLTGLRDTRAQ